MNRLFFLLLTISAMSMILSCATAPKQIQRDDPLTGKIINTKTQTEISFDSLLKDISNYDVIYFSEKHNNPEQHNIQQRIIGGLIEKGKAPTIGFEFFAMDNTPDLLNFVDSGKVAHSKKTDKIIEANLRHKLGWNTQSDEMWQYYFEILTLAKDKRLQVAGIDLANTLKKRITRKGIKNLTSLEKELIFSTKPPEKEYKDYMFAIFKAVHCGMGHKKMQSKLYDTWIARNDKMALSITKLYKHCKKPIVIIIGGGHTEYGLGVIDRVAIIDKSIKQVNISLQEITVELSNLSEYLLPLDIKGLDKSLPADYIWFTKRVSYADPCEEFKKSLKKMRKFTKPKVELP